MKKSFVEAWLSALRSGEYKQHRGSMNNSINGLYEYSKAFCCLGLGCVINAGTRKRADEDEYKDAFSFGLEESDVQKLIRMNDKEMKSFPEIADWIEANILPNATED